MASARLVQPQSWNRYSYCINNPLVYVDPSGLIWGTKDNGNGTADNLWFETEEEMNKAGYAAMTNFLARNPNGEGYLSFDRFQNHYEAVSSLAVAGGMLTGSTGLRQLGYTSREVPYFLVTETGANVVDGLYRTKTVQDLIHSQEANFLQVYIPSASTDDLQSAAQS